MKERTQLIFQTVKDIEGADGTSLVVLTDQAKCRALTVICDKAMAQQFLLRIRHTPDLSTMLPEVLVGLLFSDGLTANDFEMMVYNVLNGRYLVTLLNKQTLRMHNIRMTDAILLSYISGIPLYIDEMLMRRQCTDYVPNSRGLSIPINTIDLERLNKELAKAIENEDYRLASHLHEEIQRRAKEE